MYAIDSQKVLAAISGTSRTFRALLDFGSHVISGADVGKICIEHTMSEDDTLAIGDVLSRRAEIHLFGSRTLLKGESFRLYLYLLDYSGTSRARHRDLGQWTHRELSMLTHAQIAALGPAKDADGTVMDNVLIPFGEFVVAKVTLSGSASVITAYDRLSACDVPYTPAIDFPADSGAVTMDILQQLGISERVIAGSGVLLTADAGELLTADAQELLCSAEYTFTIQEAPTGRTCREMLGAIAAIYGGNATLDRNGACTTVFAARGGAAFDMDKLDEPELASEDISVSGIRCMLDEENELTAGDPDGAHAVTFFCPWMTAERLQAVWDAVRHLQWRPAQVHERLADPRRDIGDLRYYCRGKHKCNIPIMSLTYHFDGGLSADITAAGQSEEEI